MGGGISHIATHIFSKTTVVSIFFWGSSNELLPQKNTRIEYRYYVENVVPTLL